MLRIKSKMAKNNSIYLQSILEIKFFRRFEIKNKAKRNKYERLSNTKIRFNYIYLLTTSAGILDISIKIST